MFIASSMEITLYGRVPSKKNSKIVVCRGKYPVVLPSSSYKKWHDEQVKALSGMKYSVFGATKEITMTFYAPDARKSDLSNKVESIMDLFVDIGLLKDDNWFVCPHLDIYFGGIDRKNPRVVITIQ